MMGASWRVARHLWRYPVASPNGPGTMVTFHGRTQRFKETAPALAPGGGVSSAPSHDLPLRERWNARVWGLRPQPVDRTALRIGPRSGPSCRRCVSVPGPAGEDLRPLQAALQSIGSWRQARLRPETTA